MSSPSRARGPRSLIVLVVALLAAGCSGHTISPSVSSAGVDRSVVTLRAYGACASTRRDHPCSFYFRYSYVDHRTGRRVWESTEVRGPVVGRHASWLMEPITIQGHASSLRYSLCGTGDGVGFSPSGRHEFVCIGPDGTPRTQQGLFGAISA